jgi:holo-[acyl-carrier protein] synthase
MPIIGHGIDLVDTERIGRMVQRHGASFLRRCFTEAERAYCEANPRRRLEHLAARFAAKEAALKALGTGWSRSITWQDVEVTRQRNGQPGLALSGSAATIAEELGIQRWWLSLTHIQTHAMASAIAEGGLAESGNLL